MKLLLLLCFFFFFFQAEDGIRGAKESRGLGDVYKGQHRNHAAVHHGDYPVTHRNHAAVHHVYYPATHRNHAAVHHGYDPCPLSTSDAADNTPCVDLVDRRIIKKKKNHIHRLPTPHHYQYNTQQQ